jgi:hypothetical protein
MTETVTPVVAQGPQGAPLRRQGPKDMSLVNLVPKWSGTQSAVPLVEFLEIVEATAKMGNWHETDQIQVCAMRLTETAHSFYRAKPALRAATIK